MYKFMNRVMVTDQDGESGPATIICKFYNNFLVMFDNKYIGWDVYRYGERYRVARNRVAILGKHTTLWEVEPVRLSLL